MVEKQPVGAVWAPKALVFNRRPGFASVCCSCNKTMASMDDSFRQVVIDRWTRRVISLKEQLDAFADGMKLLAQRGNGPLRDITAERKREIETSIAELEGLLSRARAD